MFHIPGESDSPIWLLGKASFSRRATVYPKSRSLNAAQEPAGPPPRITTSNFLESFIDASVTAFANQVPSLRSFHMPEGYNAASHGYNHRPFSLSPLLHDDIPLHTGILPSIDCRETAYEHVLQPT